MSQEEEIKLERYRKLWDQITEFLNEKVEHCIDTIDVDFDALAREFKDKFHEDLHGDITSLGPKTI